MQFRYVSLLSAAALAAAQDTIDAGTVSAQNKATWCTSQQSTCPLLCTQINNGSAAYYYNDCDPTTLDYRCLCANNMSPNASEYTQTLPYFICTENNNRCVANCGAGNNQCAYNCRTNHPCGAKDPRRYNVTSTSSAATHSATATGSGSSSTSSTADAGSDGLVSVNGNGGNGVSSNSNSNAPDTSASTALIANLGLASIMGSIFAGALFVL